MLNAAPARRRGRDAVASPVAGGPHPVTPIPRPFECRGPAGQEEWPNMRDTPAARAASCDDGMSGRRGGDRQRGRNERRERAPRHVTADPGPSGQESAPAAATTASIRCDIRTAISSLAPCLDAHARRRAHARSPRVEHDGASRRSSDRPGSLQALLQRRCHDRAQESPGTARSSPSPSVPSFPRTGQRRPGLRWHEVVAGPRPFTLLHLDDKPERH